MLHRFTESLLWKTSYLIPRVTEKNKRVKGCGNIAKRYKSVRHYHYNYSDLVSKSKLDQMVGERIFVPLPRARGSLQNVIQMPGYWNFWHILMVHGSNDKIFEIVAI